MAAELNKPDNNWTKEEEAEEPAPLSLLRLRQMRKEIDAIDTQLSELLLRRLEVVSAVGNLKKNLGLPVRDIRREDAVLEKVATHVSHSPLAKNIVRLFLSIVDESCRIQDEQ